jgi:hypothetical protein
MTPDFARPDLEGAAAYLEERQPPTGLRSWTWYADYTTQGPSLTLVIDSDDVWTGITGIERDLHRLTRILGAPTYTAHGQDGRTELEWVNPDPIHPDIFGLPDNEWAMP